MGSESDVGCFAKDLRGKLTAESVWMRRMIAWCPWLSEDDLRSHLALVPLGSLILTALVCVLTASWLSWLVGKWIIVGAKVGRERKLRLAPGPAAWPILGNLLQLQRHPHRSLAKMAEQYGELMTVHMGTTPTLVVSSPAAAKEVLLTQGTTFASRPLPPTADAWSYGGRDLGLAPYGPLWRKQRKIATVQLFSPRRMVQVDAIRRRFTDFLEEELLRKGQEGAHPQEGRNEGRKEGGDASPPAATLCTETTSYGNPATVHVGVTDKLDNTKISKDRQATDGRSYHPDRNECGPSGAAGTMDGLHPVHLRENVFQFALDTLTYVIFGCPVSPAMRRHVAKALATKGGSTTTTMKTRVQHDDVEDATATLSDASVQTKGGGAPNDDDQMVKMFYEVVLSTMQAVATAQIPDFVPSLRFFYRGYLQHVRGLSDRFRAVTLKLVEKRREFQRKVSGSSCTTLDDRDQEALRAAGFINPEAMVDVVFDNLSPPGFCAPKSSEASSIKDGNVEYGETEACMLLMDLVSGGTDTTTSVTVFLLMELLHHPEKLAMLRAELGEAVGMLKVPSENDLENLPYLNAVLYETLRLHTPAPLLVPHQATDDAVVFGYDVPAGTSVIVNAWAIMHDPQVWSDPWEFRPERFIQDGLLADDMHPDGKNFRFFPFGSGRRMCPGIRFALTTVRFVVSRLLQRFDVMLPPGVQPEDVDLTEHDGIVIFPENPMPVIFRPRLVV